MKGIRIFDNLGRTVDRYTIVIRNGTTEDIYTMSEDASAVNMYCYSAELGATKPHNNEVELHSIPEKILPAVTERLD